MFKVLFLSVVVFFMSMKANQKWQIMRALETYVAFFKSSVLHLAFFRSAVISMKKQSSKNDKMSCRDIFNDSRNFFILTYQQSMSGFVWSAEESKE